MRTCRTWSRNSTAELPVSPTPSRIDPDPPNRYTVENSVYVARWAQRQGIGSQLLVALVSACERTGARQMVAIIGGVEHTASIRAHEKAGFRQVGTLENVGWKHGRWLDYGDNAARFEPRRRRPTGRRRDTQSASSRRVLESYVYVVYRRGGGNEMAQVGRGSPAPLVLSARRIAPQDFSRHASALEPRC